MQITARNCFKGTVSAIERGAVFAKIKITVAEGVTITSAVLNESIDELGLAVGKEAYAIVKSTDVMVAVD